MDLQILLFLEFITKYIFTSNRLIFHYHQNRCGETLINNSKWNKLLVKMNIQMIFLKIYLN